MYNAVGEGPISAPQEVFVGEAGMCLLPPTTRSASVTQMNWILVACLICRLICLPVLVPTSPPLNVMVQSSTATQLDVMWDPPPLDAQNGDIQGYKVSIITPFPQFHWKTLTAALFYLVSQVYFWEYQLRNETERLRTLFLPELGVKLKNLTGYTTYMISVAAFNAAGDGPRSLPTRGRTQQAGESQ